MRVCAASITASALVIDNDDKEGESENENNKFASFAIEVRLTASPLSSHVLRAALLLLGLLRCAEGACLLLRLTGACMCVCSQAIRPVKVFWDPSVSVGAGAFSNAASALRAAAPALVALLALLATALARHA